MPFGLGAYIYHWRNVCYVVFSWVRRTHVCPLEIVFLHSRKWNPRGPLQESWPVHIATGWTWCCLERVPREGRLIKIGMMQDTLNTRENISQREVRRKVQTIYHLSHCTVSITRGPRGQGIKDVGKQVVNCNYVNQTVLHSSIHVRTYVLFDRLHVYTNYGVERGVIYSRRGLEGDHHRLWSFIFFEQKAIPSTQMQENVGPKTPRILHLSYMTSYFNTLTFLVTSTLPKST